MLFFGWGCYMILQTYRPRVMENESMSISPEKYPTMFESLSEIQKSHPSTDVPVIFVKPEVIIDKLNNLLESMKFNKDQNVMQNKAIVTNVANRVQRQNSSNVQSKNIVEIKDVNELLATLLSGNLMRDEKFSSLEYVDENISTDQNKESIRPAQFLEKLQNVSKMKATNDLKKFEDRIDFIKNVDRLMLKSQENHALAASNKLKSSEFVVTTISNPENFVDHTSSIDLTNTLQDLKQKFSDLIKDATQDNYSENDSSFDETNERVDARLEPYLVICPPYESHEFSDILVKDSSKDSLEKFLEKDSQPILAQEISEQIGNESSDDIDKRIEDKQDVDDSDMSMSASSDASASRIQDRFMFDISAIVQNIEKQHLSKSITNIKEDEKYESTEIENLNKLWFLQPTMQDVELSTPNIDNDFQWFNMPSHVANLGRGDISKSNEMQSSLWDTYEDMNVDDIIPGSQCEITIKMGILKVKCATIKFDEEWNFTSPEIPIADVPKVTNFEDILNVYHTECKEDASEQLGIQNISNENVDKEATMSQDSVPKIINKIDLQESTTSAKISNDALLDSYVAPYTDFPFHNGEINQDYYDYTDPLFDNSNEETTVTTISSSISEFSSSIIDSNEKQNPFFDISSTQQPKQLKISKEQDYSISDNTETSLNDFEYFYALKKKLTSLFKNEMSNIMTQYLPKNFYENYRHKICSIFRYMRSLSQHSWDEQYVALRQLLEYIRNLDYSHNIDDDYHRKKRMVDDLTWQQGMSITLKNRFNKF